MGVNCNNCPKNDHHNKTHDPKMTDGCKTFSVLIQGGCLQKAYTDYETSYLSGKKLI